MTSSSSKQSKHNLIIAVIIFLLFTTGGATYYVYHQQQTALKAKAEQERIAAENKEKKDKTRLEIQKLFDLYLNNFKNELHEKAKSYKKARNILKEIKNPYNFETPEYAKENYTLFKKTIAPSLRQKASDIINTFDIYRKKVEANLKDKDNELQQDFLKKWKDMNQQQLTKYVDFFSKEEDLVQAYDDLITFYYVHSRLYEVDIEKNQFNFSRKEDEKKASELLERVKTLQKPPIKNNKIKP